MSLNQLETKEPRIAVLIPVYNRRELTLKCIEQLLGLDSVGSKLDLIVIDDASTDGTGEAIRKSYPEVVVLKGDGNLWWTGAINKGVAYAVKNECDYVLTVNDDVEFEKDFLKILIETNNKYPGSIVSAVSLLHNNDNKDDIIVTAGHKISGRLRHLIPAVSNHNISGISEEIIFCDALSGRSLLIPLEVIKKIGFFDAKRFPHGHGDIEFTHRAKLAGFHLIVNIRSRIFTELNKNHFPVYVINSSRWGFMKNLFNIRFAYGFKMIFSLAFMHKPFHIGVIDLFYRLARVFKWLFIKLFMPKSFLRALVTKKIDMTLYGSYIN